jgi:hypothetical protein
VLHKNAIKNSIYYIVSSVCIELSRLIKISFMIGSKISFFSAVNIMAPMTGVLGGTYRGLSLLVIHSLYKWILIGGSIFPLIGYHIPHFFASFYWTAESKFAKSIVPIVCMIIFIAHPVGSNSIPYALLWLIPIGIALSNSKNIYLIAFGSTFTAHAVGSVLWIFSMPMNPQTWISLIPIALCERALFACGMVVIYFVFNFVKSTIKERNLNINFGRIFGKIN